MVDSKDALEHLVHLRYLRIRSIGVRLILWCESGQYYTSPTPLNPDFANKSHIGLGPLIDLLTLLEIIYGLSPITVETTRKITPASIDRSQSVPTMHRT